MLFTSLPVKCSLAAGNTTLRSLRRCQCSPVSTGGPVCSRALPPINSCPPLATDSLTCARPLKFHQPGLPRLQPNNIRHGVTCMKNVAARGYFSRPVLRPPISSN